MFDCSSMPSVAASYVWFWYAIQRPTALLHLVKNRTPGEPSKGEAQPCRTGEGVENFFTCDGKYVPQANSIERAFLEDSAQFEEHAAMPGCSNRPAELDGAKYGIGNKRNHCVARRLRLKRRRKDPAYFKQAVEIESFAEQDRKLANSAEIASLKLVILVGEQFVFSVSRKGVGATQRKQRHSH